jgi:hypothetical protein
VPAGRARARWLRPWWGTRECSIEPCRSEQDVIVVCSERGRWRSVTCRQSGGGGSPAAERGGAGGGEQWRASLPVRVFQMERGRASGGGVSGHGLVNRGAGEVERSRGATGCQVPPAPAHGGYGARGVCRGRVRRTRERERGGVDGEALG